MLEKVKKKVSLARVKNIHNLIKINNKLNKLIIFSIA